MNGNTQGPRPKIEGKGIVKGPALKFLEASPDSPTAYALNEIVHTIRPAMAELVGDWTPQLVIDKAAQLIDAEMRLGDGGDMRGVALQVAALMLVTVEKIELNS